ncbi:TonB-dependent receptor family protein [Methylobacterium sp. E-045]|uniref:TonB-dependent receptor family protein n=1 Tax=Methylobacterium sp. E-045 TaxID=2836575 RepID=UPI001FB95318|nr:TonB-dependent receptor [Methylobacterium sp. E-045]MCJ2131718.1 TonB-dependent receptor [Methylobacterium sp. E-045]
MRLLATAPLLAVAAQAQTESRAVQTVTLDELSVEAVGGSKPPAVGQPQTSLRVGGLPPVSTPTPIDKPVGEVVTSVGREGVIDKRAATSIADVLVNSPGVTVRQNYGPRDFLISIRGSNARSNGGSRNIVALEDGFPVTQADGFSRFDYVDPRAYSRIDVFRGPQSTYFGNYATGGALNFITRRGAEINGAEYGIDAGSFGYLNNYATVGGVNGPFEYSLFTSDTRGNGFIGHNSFNTQTVNFLGTFAPTTDDRFTLKVINNELFSNLPERSSLNQFHINPFQRGCASAAAAAPGCTTVNLLTNGRFGATVPVTADEGSFSRGDRRTIIGGRWEHDFDAFTTWRTSLVFDDRYINQPFYALGYRGDFAGFNVLTDLTRRGDLFGLPATAYLAFDYNTLDSKQLTYNRLPYIGPRFGGLVGDLSYIQSNLGGRARIELQLNERWIAVAGVSAESTTIDGRNTTYSYTAASTIPAPANVNRDFLNVAPEASLLYRANEAWQFRGRVATGYGTPPGERLFVTPAGLPGNNTQLKTQENLGFDLGADWSPLPGVRFNLTGFYEFFRNELVTQSPGAGLLSYAFNAPASEHRGVEFGADWAFAPGWRAVAAYTFDDQFYTQYTEQLSAGSLTRRFDRAGRRIPGVPANELLVRVGYEQTTGTFAGLGGYVETVFQDDFFIDNANQLKMPGYAVVNLNLHYATDLAGYAKRVNVFFEVRNLFDKTYVGSAQNLANSISASTGLLNGAGVLANATGSIFAGAPRNFIGGMKLSF